MIGLQKVVVDYVLVEDHLNLGHMGVVMLEETRKAPLAQFWVMVMVMKFWMVELENLVELGQ